MNTDQCRTLNELLRYGASHFPAKFTFLENGETPDHELSLRELDERATAIAQRLLGQAQRGDRALLLLPPGLNYLASLFGCLYAGIVAVPAYAPRTSGRNERLESIAADCDAALALTTSGVLSRLDRVLDAAPRLKALKWLDAAEIPEPAGASLPDIAERDLAFLQYTSGTTGTPRGVMLSHGNLVANISRIDQMFGLRSREQAVFWLPPYHDMGLIGGLLTPLKAGGSVYLMPPAAFIQKPLRWLQLLSSTGAEISGAPNFAYELCARKVTEEQLEMLDLSAWELAFVGAEPISDDTLRLFAKTFEPCGFKPQALYACYGLAEATLMVSGNTRSERVVTRTVDREELEKGRIVSAAGDNPFRKELVGCGRPLPQHRVRIIDSETGRPCPPERVGEIWVHGPSIASGYWNRPEDTDEKFNGRVEDDEHAYLRTGDLGFLADGELYVTGRIDDMLIVRGRNYYARDVERWVQNSHPALHAMPGVVTTLDTTEGTQLVVIQEVARDFRRQCGDDVGVAIRQAIADEFELEAHEIVLVNPATLPRTSSGKTQRNETRRRYLNDELGVIRRWLHRPVADMGAAPPQESPPPPAAGEAGLDAVRQWVVSKISRHLQIPAEQIDTEQPFARYGLDSVTLVSFSGELGEWLGRDVSPTLLYDVPTIEAFVQRVVEGEQPAAQAAPAAAGPASYEPIAVIGVSCRFPGAASPDEFWRMLEEGQDGISEIQEDRWSWFPDHLSTRRAGLITDVDQFDAGFFGIAPNEASQIDPQHRLLLEVAWEALENAGRPPSRMSGADVGVFVGVANPDYARVATGTHSIGRFFGSGNALSMAAHRLSYHFNLTGPSMAVDTACSSSLVAVHLACQSLHSGDCATAIAGGVNLILSPELSTSLSQAEMLSPRGQCSTFDASADGYVRSEGCGVVVLKKLTDAVRDGDSILAVIRGSAINQDGRSNGITAPNGAAQERLIREVMRRAAVGPADISFVETHGTGTVLGDPVEFNALKAALSSNGTPLPPCALGAVKTNIGHLESAAGIAGLIKTVLALVHRTIPPNLHLQKLNPHIHLENSRFSIPTQVHGWQSTGPRLAGVSSFGFGGTNAHVLLQEAPQGSPREAGVERPRHLLTLSAKSEQSLARLTERYVAQLEQSPEHSAADICYSANTGREAFAHRLAATGATCGELRRRLIQFCEGREQQGVFAGKAPHQPPRLAFVFTGQGSQYLGMGHALLRHCPSFRDQVLQCDEILKNVLSDGDGPQSHDCQLLPVLLGEADPKAVHEAGCAQPALFALEYSLAQMLRSWGIEPTAVMGHSFGEYVAACVAGVFDLESALRLVAQRARLVDSLPRDGEMACAFAPLGAVQPVVDRHGDVLAIAAINGEDNTVISGQRQAVRLAVDALEARGVVVKMLSVTHAFHSPLMDPLLDSFEEFAGSLQYAPPQIDLVFNVTGEAGRDVPGAQYWRRHIREPVRFADGIQALIDRNYDHFLEIGPHPALSAMAAGNARSQTAWLPTLRRNSDDWQVLLDSVAQLYVAGVDVDWESFDRDYQRQRTTVPTYAFHRRRHWVEEARPKLAAPEIAAAVNSGLESLRQECQVEPYLEAEPELNRLVAGYAVQALTELGAQWRAGERWQIERLIRQLNVVPQRRRLLVRLLGMLAEDGLLNKTAEGWEVVDTWPGVRPAKIHAELSTGHRNAAAELQLAERCGENLAQVINGQAEPLQLLFPDGSADLLEQLYQDSPVARYYNLLVRDAVREAVQRLPADAPLRVLEIGAGTGGTTAHILPVLPAERTQYVFSDISQLFLLRAEEKFSSFPFVRYQVLDIGRSPFQQGFQPGQFDIVLAANALHATPDLQASVSHALQVLSPRGMLVLLEGVRPHRLLDLIFGLTDGWWSFTDTDLRPEHALISRGRWLQLLADLGCRQTATLTASPDEDLGGQSVILASDPPAAEVAVAVPAAAWEPAASDTGVTHSSHTPARPPAMSVDKLREADSEQRSELLAQHLRQHLAGVLGAEPEDVDLDQPVAELGLDSLMAVQLKNRMQSELGVSPPVVAFLQGLTVRQLIDNTLSQLFSEGGIAEMEFGAESDEGYDLHRQEDRLRLMQNVDQLSDSELDSVLSQLLTEGDLPDSDGS